MTAREQRDPELSFEFQHGSADWGGGELQPRGGVAKVQFLSDREECLQVPHLHDATVCGRWAQRSTLHATQRDHAEVALVTVATSDDGGSIGGAGVDPAAGRE